MKIRLRGIGPLLLHNGRLANPLDKYSKMLKALTSKRNKTEEDYEKIARVEFEGGWYLGQTGGFVLPAHGLETLMKVGAKINKNGKRVSSGSFITADAPLVFKGSEKTIDELWNGGEHALMANVRVGQQRVLRTRPMVPDGWTCEFEVQYEPKIVTDEIILQAFVEAGLRSEAFEWRHKYGKFAAERI